MHPHHGVPIIGVNSMSSVACTTSEVPTYYGEPIALWSFCWLLAVATIAGLTGAPVEIQSLKIPWPSDQPGDL